MPPEAVSTGESQPADDIRSALAAAIAEHNTLEPPVTPEAKAAADPAEKPEAQVGGEQPEAEAADKARGPDGKFVKKEAAETEPVAESAEGEAKKDEQKPEAIEPPPTWKAEDKETFAKLPTEAQKILVARQKDMDADYTRKTQAVAALKTDYEPVQKLLAPYAEQMKARGFTPHSLIEAWANAEKRLAEDPVSMLRDLVVAYKVDPGKLTAALGIRIGAGGSGGSAAEGEQPQPDPQQHIADTVRAILTQEIAPIKQEVSGLTQAQRAAQEAAVNAQTARAQSQIDEFKSAKDDKGTLLHPHFEEVATEVLRLAKLDLAEGQPVRSLKDLYETAVWANPSTREKLLTAKEQHAEQKRKDEARAKAAAAKKAASPVTGAPGPGQAVTQATRADKSLRETLEDAAEDQAAA